jgi:glutaminyl-tRNA synthetase
LHYSDKVQFKDIESEALTKLYSMSLKSQMPIVRHFSKLNLEKNIIFKEFFKDQLLD